MIAVRRSSGSCSTARLTVARISSDRADASVSVCARPITDCSPSLRPPSYSIGRRWRDAIALRAVFTAMRYIHVERAVASEGTERTVGLDEGLLCHVLGLSRITKQSCHQFDDLMLISEHQQVERTPLRPPHELQVALLDTGARPVDRVLRLVRLHRPVGGGKFGIETMNRKPRLPASAGPQGGAREPHSHFPKLTIVYVPRREPARKRPPGHSPVQHKRTTEQARTRLESAIGVLPSRNSSRTIRQPDTHACAASGPD